jgi:serine/threonine protein kinase
MNVNSMTVVEEFFLEALNQPEEERPAFLASRCERNSQLSAIVESLLAVHYDGAPSILDRALASPLPAQHLPGETLGLYLLLRQLGAGGMGIVYLACERNPIQRLVALKLLRPVLETKSMLYRCCIDLPSNARRWQQCSIPRFHASSMLVRCPAVGSFSPWSIAMGIHYEVLLPGTAASPTACRIVCSGV